MNQFESENGILVKQIKECMPLIEIERLAFIKAEHGRLAAIIGTGYWDEKIEDFQIFHGKKGDDLALIDDRPHDPYEITIEELYWITTLYKKIERVGTETYTLFFNMMPEDKKRIELLSRMWHKLSRTEVCTEAEIKELTEGHDAFIGQKLEDPVKVINNITFDKEPDGGRNGGFNFNSNF